MESQIILANKIYVFLVLIFEVLFVQTPLGTWTWEALFGSRFLPFMVEYCLKQTTMSCETRSGEIKGRLILKKKKQELSPILEKSMDSDSKPAHNQNLIDCSFSHFPSLLKFSPKFIRDFLSYLVQNQINKYMNGQKCNLLPGQRR